MLSALAAVGVLAAGCGGDGTQASPTCLGEQLAVADGWVSPVGTGRSQSDSYEVSILLFNTSQGDRIAMESFTGAMASIPPTAMNGYIVYEGHRVELIERNIPPPEGKIGPCLRLEVATLPPDWKPPGLDEQQDGH